MTTCESSEPSRSSDPAARWFLPLMAVAGCTLSLTAPLEVLYARELGYGAVLIGAFMLTAGIGVILVDVFGTRLVPALDARTCLTVALVAFGLACIAMAFAWSYHVMMVARVVQGIAGGMMLGGGLQAAIRVRSHAEGAARALGRFNAAFLCGAAVGSPGGLLVAAGVAGRAGFQIAFVSAGIVALLVAVVLHVALPSLAGPGSARPVLGLPRLGRAAGTLPALAIATVGDFMRGGVLFTALPLAGAARGYSTLVIGLAIALMSAAEIALLTVAHRLLARLGLGVAVASSLTLGGASAGVIAVTGQSQMYLVASTAFGVALAGTTIGLPLVVVGFVGDASAGLAQFRISAGVGMLVGSVGSAVAVAVVGPGTLFAVIAVILAASTLLLRDLKHQVRAPA